MVWSGGGGGLRVHHWSFSDRTQDYTTSYPVSGWNCVNLQPISIHVHVPKLLKFCKNCKFQPINIPKSLIKNSAKIYKFVTHEYTKLAANLPLSAVEYPPPPPSILKFWKHHWQLHFCNTFSQFDFKYLLTRIFQSA